MKNLDTNPNIGFFCTPCTVLAHECTIRTALLDRVTWVSPSQSLPLSWRCLPINGMQHSPESLVIYRSIGGGLCANFCKARTGSTKIISSGLDMCSRSSIIRLFAVEYVSRSDLWAPQIEYARRSDNYLVLSYNQYKFVWKVENSANSHPSKARDIDAAPRRVSPD